MIANLSMAWRRGVNSLGAALYFGAGVAAFAALVVAFLALLVLIAAMGAFGVLLVLTATGGSWFGWLLAVGFGLLAGGLLLNYLQLSFEFLFDS